MIRAGAEVAAPCACVRGGSVLCDVCGRSLVGLGDAVLVLRFDDRDVVVEVGVVHSGCVRGQGEGRVEVFAAADVLAAPASARLCQLARLPESASLTRALRKLDRLRVAP